MEKLLDTLMAYLLAEDPRYRELALPHGFDEKFRLYRALVNVRPPLPAPASYLAKQDEFLQEMALRKGIVTFRDMQAYDGDMYLWQGDITRLKVDAIVNAANTQMLGCFVPNHGCIDNAIHTFAGMQLRGECAMLMQQQGKEEAIGQAKLTRGYNLPAKYVLHTVGPIIHGRLQEYQKQQLASCYTSCLKLARQHNLDSVAFCCISTGEFHFPQAIAADIAVETVRRWKQESGWKGKVIWNVFKDEDRQLYEERLSHSKTL